MTPGHLEVSVTRLRRSAAQMQGIADRFSQQVTAFRSRIAGFGEPWGGDDIGLIIGTAHSAVLEAALECFTTNAEELAGRADELGQAADNHDQAEDANVLYVNRVNELL